MYRWKRAQEGKSFNERTDVITEFRGRGDEVHMHPLSFAEFMSVYSGTKQDCWNEYMLYGGLPPVMNISSPEEKIIF